MKRDYFVGFGGGVLLLLSAWMIYANKDNWGWVMFAGIILIGSTTISKKDIEGVCDEEDDK